MGELGAGGLVELALLLQLLLKHCALGFVFEGELAQLALEHALALGL